MQTRRTTTRENQWGDNEEEEVSKAPEGPALGYYYSNGPAWTAGAARWRSILHSFFFFFGPERVHVMGFNLFTFWGQQAGPLLLLDSIEFWAWSGPWCHQARNSSRDLNICRLAAVFLTALPAGAGLDAFTDMSGRHQLVVRLCYDEYDEVGLIHQYYTGRLRGALFPGLIRKHGSVHEYGRGLISLRGRGGNIFSPSLSLQENNA